MGGGPLSYGLKNLLKSFNNSRLKNIALKTSK